MSRLSKKPIIIPNGISVVKDGNALSVKGAKGEERVLILPFLHIAIEAGTLSVSAVNSVKQARANVGTMVALTRNAIQGLTEGFIRVLEIEGVGYRAALEGNTLVLSLGYVNPIRIEIPKEISVAVEKNVMRISGTNKGAVTQFAAKVRALKKPEPYKGKGIRYQGEVIRRKVGKKAAAAKAG